MIRQFFHILWLLSLCLLLLWFGGLLWFIQTIPSHVDDPATHTDGIVALTGGSNRISTALELLKEGKSDNLLITGVGQGITLANLKRLDPIPDPMPDEDKITLGYIAKDTRQNAKETAIWVDFKSISSLRLVTANYHIPRAMMEFKRLMPDVTFIPHPVFPRNVKIKYWWYFPGSTQLIISEYHKYMGSVIQHSFIDSLLSLNHWLAGAAKNQNHR